MNTAGLEVWFQQRPKWLQDAARRLVQSEGLSAEDFVALLAICKSEASGQAVAFSGLPPNALSVTETQKPLRLNTISNVQGINALIPRKPLDFGDNPLCIVYGRNASGKSGYVRLLKHACGARRPGELLANVYSGAAPQQSAEFTFTETGQTKEAMWNGSLIRELTGVEIYDTASGLAYVDEENEVSYEPWPLRLFTKLANVCTKMSSRLIAEEEKQVSRKPAFPAECGGTKAANFYQNIKPDTSDHMIAQNTKWNPEDDSRLNEIVKRLAEANPAQKATALRGQKKSLLTFFTDLKNLYGALSDDRCVAYRKLKNDGTVKRKAADEDAAKIFSQAPLTGVGSETWRLLWEQARRYSKEIAYKEQSFPNVEPGARCVLCQQELNQESRNRFVSFESFVKGELQRLAKEAEESFRKASDAIQAAEVVTTSMDGIEIIGDETRQPVTDFIESLCKRREEVLGEGQLAAVKVLPEKSVLVMLVKAMRRLASQARSFDADTRSQNRQKLEEERKELAAQKWLSQQRKAIEDEIARLKVIHHLDQAEKLTDTHALSTRKSILAEELVTDAYISRFEKELEELGASYIKIELKKTRADVGKVYHQICLKNSIVKTKVSNILSEGEFRIVSFAAFLADTEGREGKTPFVFDDPISSLDHVFEEAAAQRLAELGKIRQVIVFTHRLSLVGFLEKYAKKCGIKTNIICLSKYTTGDIAELPINLKKTDNAATWLLDRGVAAAKNALQQGDAAYEKEAKSLCRDIRVLLERIVEKDLLNQIVTRFSPEIQTKGKIGALAKITEEDCGLIDYYMTKYSRYEHSQPDEALVDLPKPDEIEMDLKEIKEFIRSLKERNK